MLRSATPTSMPVSMPMGMLNTLNPAPDGSLPTMPAPLTLDAVPLPHALPDGSSPANISSASSSAENLPNSVRGAPPALRRLIRKRQNSESAKRCRQRKKLEDVRAADELASQGARLRRLESLVAWLCSTQEATQSALAALCQRPGICDTTNNPSTANTNADAEASSLAAKIDEIQASTFGIVPNITRNGTPNATQPQWTNLVSFDSS